MEDLIKEAEGSAQTFVVVGAGQAGVEVATALRSGGFKGRLVLIGDEPHPPYQRPPLSKEYLVHGGSLRALTLKSRDALQAADIELKCSVMVEKMDRSRRLIHLSDGGSLGYEKLALATGGRPRRLVAHGLPAVGAPPNLHYVRTIDDVDRLRDQLCPAARLLIVGGGYIGLEIAASASKRGAVVTLLESQDRLLARVTAPVVSAFYEERHRAHGVDIHLSTEIRKVVLGSDLEIVSVETTKGECLEVDVVVIGIGLEPNVELAVAAGLRVENGIVVDEFCRTEDPHIVAAGDCANFPFGPTHRRIRLESVPNAMEQARCAAATMLGILKPHAAVPWFWSNQYDLKLQMAGLSAGFEQIVVRGEPNEHSFLAIYLLKGQVIAVDAVNRPQDFAIAKRLVGSTASISTAALVDITCSLKDLVAAAAAATVTH